MYNTQARAIPLYYCCDSPFNKLLNKYPFDKITIDLIVRTAGVGRATWFRHFSSKQEAIVYKLKLLWYRWCTDNNVNEWRKFDTDNVEPFLLFFYTYRDIHMLLYKAGLKSCVYEGFYEIMSEGYRSEKTGNYHAGFFAYGLFGFISEWIAGGYNENIEQMISIFKNKIIKYKF